MSLHSAFKERLRDMENSQNTRNQRLSLLQDEKDLQGSKSLLLSAKHAKIRLLEQKCLMLDRKFASDNFKITSLKCEIEFLDQKYETCAQQLRDLKVEVEDLEELKKERETFYSVKCSEMRDFKNDKLNLCYLGLQERNRKALNHDIEAAEMRKSELLALKQKVNSSLESNKEMRAELQEQL